MVSAPFVDAVAPANVNETPDVTTLIVALVPVDIVNALLDVSSAAPVYFKIPLPNIKLVLALVAALKLLEVLKPLPIAPTLKVPALIVTTPVCKFVPVKINVPAPALVRFPVVAAADPLIVNSVPLVEISKVPVVPVLIVKFLFVEALAPVYFKVPLLNTKLDAVVSACPKLPATPPSPIVATLNVPALIVVAPV